MFRSLKFWKTIFFAWIIFIGIDFFFHAALISALWNENIQAIKAPEELFRLIPAGYGSFLLLTILIVFVFYLAEKHISSLPKAFGLGMLIGLLFSASYFLGLYSFIEIPVKQLAAFSFVYLIEIISVILVSYYSAKTTFSRLAIVSITVFLILVLLGVLIQNLQENLA